MLVDVGDSYCPPHQAEHDRARQAKRDQARKRDASSGRKPSYRWYGLRAWKRRSKAQLNREPLCSRCNEFGLTRLATVADHIEPHREDPEKFWRGALQSLCSPCHSSAKQREENAAARAEGG